MIRRAQLAPLLVLAACSHDAQSDAPVWVDDTLDGADRVAWPGVDRESGRVIPLVNGFANGGPAAYWFAGLAPTATDDVFVVCRDGDAECPADPRGAIAWQRTLGRPIFARLPGDPRYSPWWQLWTVRVGADHPPDTLRTLGDLFRAVGDGEARVEAHRLPDGAPALVHLLLVLRGTTLEGIDVPLADGSGAPLPIERRAGWRQGLLVDFLDFSRSEGLFAGDVSRGGRPEMPAGNIYVFFHRCTVEPLPALCATPGGGEPDLRLISEHGLGEDITGDGDRDDTNNLLGAMPSDRPDLEEPAYSPLWAVRRVEVLPGSPLALLDTTRDQSRSDIASTAAMREAIAREELGPPAPATLIPGGDPEVTPLFFDCPVPVPGA